MKSRLCRIIKMAGLTVRPGDVKEENYNLALADYLSKELRIAGLNVSKRDALVQVALNKKYKDKYEDVVIDCMNGKMYLRGKDVKDKYWGKLRRFDNGNHTADAYHCTAQSATRIINRIKKLQDENKQEVLADNLQKNAADEYSVEKYLQKKENKIDDAFEKAWNKTFEGLSALESFISKDSVYHIETWDNFLNIPSLMGMQGLAMVKELRYKERISTQDVKYLQDFTKDYLKEHEDKYRPIIEKKLDYVKKHYKIESVDELLDTHDEVNQKIRVVPNLDFDIVGNEMFGYLNGYIAKGESFVEIEQDLQKAIDDGLITGETADMILGYVDNNIAFVLTSTRGDVNAEAKNLKEYLHVKKVYTMPDDKSTTRLAKIAAAPNSDQNFSDEECLDAIRKEYPYIFDENKYERCFFADQGVTFFYSRGISNLENVQYPIIFYNEIYTFREKKSTGNYITFLISWKFDTEGNIMTNDFNITKDMLKLQDPTVTEFIENASKVLTTVKSGGKTLSSAYNIEGAYSNFDEALAAAKKEL